MPIVARTSKQISPAEEAAIHTFFQNPALFPEHQVADANALEDFMYRWNVVINAESLAVALEKLTEAGVIKLKSAAQIKCEQAAQGCSTEQQNILADFLKSRHLISPPADKGFENAAALLTAMRGRSFGHSNLDWCLTYLQSKGHKLFWEARPSQSRENIGHRAVSPEDFRFAPKETTNTPGPGLVSHSSNPKFNGQAEREAREAEKRRFNPDAKLEADIALARSIWNEQISKAIAEGRTHSERARIAQAAQQAPGGPRLQAAAAQREAGLIRRERERAR